MTAAVILLPTLLLLVLLLQLRVGISVKYNSEGLCVWACAGGLRFLIYPGKKKEAKQKKSALKSQRQKAAPVQEETELGGPLDYIKGLLPLALEAASQLRRKLRIDYLRLKVTAGSSDPADAVMLYGYANAALAELWWPLNQAFQIEDGLARVEVDLDQTNVSIYLHLTCTIELGQALWLGLYYGVGGLRTFLYLRSEHKKTTETGKAE